MTTDEWFSNISGWTREHTVHFVDDGGHRLQKSFRDYGKALDFLTDKQASEPQDRKPARSAGPANRAFFNRIAGRKMPKDAPTTLAGVVTRITGQFQHRGR